MVILELYFFQTSSIRSKKRKEQTPKIKTLTILKTILLPDFGKDTCGFILIGSKTFGYFLSS